MNLLVVSYSAAGKRTRFYIDGKRVNSTAYYDAIDAATMRGRSQNSFIQRNRYNAAGDCTARAYSCI